MDVSEGTGLEDLKAVLAIRCGVNIGATARFGFEEAWPPQIKRQFLDPSSDARRWSWAELR